MEAYVKIHKPSGWQRGSVYNRGDCALLHARSAPRLRRIGATG